METSTYLLTGIIALLFIWIMLITEKRNPEKGLAKIRKNGTIAWIEREIDDDNLEHTFMRMKGEAMVYRLPLEQDTSNVPFEVGDQVTIIYDDHFPAQLISIKAHPGDRGI